MRVRSLGKGLYALTCSSYSPSLVAAAKAVPGMRWEPATREWYGYADAVAAVVARLKHGGLRVQTDALASADGWTTVMSPFCYSVEGLREYQVEGVRFLTAHAEEGALLADGMRLGKSAQATRTARAFKQKTVVICPSHVVGVWGRPPDSPAGPGEIAKWWPKAWTPLPPPAEEGGPLPLGVVTLEGVKPSASQDFCRKYGTPAARKKITPDILAELDAATAAQTAYTRQLDGTNVVVVSYDIVYAWVDVLLAWGAATLLIDECHALQGYNSRRSVAVRTLAQGCKYRVGLSGTPMTSRPRDLHNVIDTLCPGRFGYFFTHRPESGSFAKNFCAAHQETIGKGPEARAVWNFDGSSNLSAEELAAPVIVGEETLRERLKYFMLRRVKSEVDNELPAKTRQIVDVRIPPKTMIAPSTSMFTGGKAMRVALDLAADGKLKPVVDLVYSHLEEGEKVICFCYRRMFAEAVARLLEEKDKARAVMIRFVHGGVPQAQRDIRIEDVRKAAAPAVLVATIDTTSTGIDLSYAGVAVFGELTWEPQDLVQAEERLYKYGAEGKSLIQYVIARGTGDELVLRGVINKLTDFEHAIGPTGDRMREDLEGGKTAAEREEHALGRLRDALFEMQQAKAPKASKASKALKAPRALKVKASADPAKASALEAPPVQRKKRQVNGRTV